MQSDLNALATFVTVAQEGSFTAAAKRQGVSPSAISHAMRALEDDLGVRLLSRTTRSMSLTEAGKSLLERLQPALTELQESVKSVSEGRNRPAGRVRLLVPRLAVDSVLRPKLGELHRKYPDIVLDIITDDSRRDIVAESFDAGIQIGEYIQKDMIAVRVSRDHRPAIVGSPAYFKHRAHPREPRELSAHQCINFRHGSTGLYRWEFQKGRKELSIAVEGPLIVDDLRLVLQGALDGLGLAFLEESNVVQLITQGKLVRVLEDWCQPYPGFFLYYPSRRQQTAALSAVIGTLRC